MRITKKNEIQNEFVTPQGEIIYELIGVSELTGETTHHSLAHIVIPSGKSCALHYHKISEETYYILNGEGWMRVDHEEFSLQPGQACLIEPGEKHQIFNRGEVDLEFLAVCAPAWVPEDS
ncbi:MAG: cupin domain-containing protein, partial [Anaerolineales bacterium]|nr:cupin domain-containing protein [Anaerolineales bacterium]